MPVDVSWDDQCRRCIRFVFDSAWLWDDFHNAIVTAHIMIDATDKERIEYLFDVRHAHVFPRDLLHKMRRVRIKLHEKVNTLVVVGQGTFAQALIQLLESIAADTNSHIKLVASLEEAYALIDATNSPSEE